MHALREMSVGMPQGSTPEKSDPGDSSFLGKIELVRLFDFYYKEFTKTTKNNDKKLIIHICNTMQVLSDSQWT